METDHIQVCTKSCDGKWDAIKWQPHGWYLTKKKMSACNEGVGDDSKRNIVAERAVELLEVEEREVREEQMRMMEES